MFAAAIVMTAFSPHAVFAKGKGGKKGPPADPVTSYLKKHDENKNGAIERSECSSSDTTFSRADANHDGKLDKAELADLLHVSEPKKKK